MTTGAGPLAGRRVLVVEDDFIIAESLAMFLAAQGATIMGPAGTTKDALSLIATNERLDGAVLDINLRGETAYPVADALRSKGVPVVFLTGYDDGGVAPRYADAPHFQKPAAPDALVRALLG